MDKFRCWTPDCYGTPMIKTELIGKIEYELLISGEPSAGQLFECDNPKCGRLYRWGDDGLYPA